MAKGRRPKGKKKKTVVRIPRPVRGSRTTEYVQLLMNPCTGPLVHAPGATEGGQVMRFENDIIIGNGGTEVGGVFNWTPGALNASASSGGQGFIDAVYAAAGPAVLPGSRTYSPGRAFLLANASSYRCIAACVQVFWPGSEVNRAGIVAGAQGTYGLFSSGATCTPSSIRAICPVVERMPSDHIELKWAPNYADGLFRNPSSTNAPEDGHASILFSWEGIPVSTGIRVRLVAVYEWRAYPTGLVLNSNTSLGDPGSIQEVRRALDKSDANWWNRTGQAAYNFLSGATVAYMTRRASGFNTRQPRIEL